VAFDLMFDMVIDHYLFSLIDGYQYEYYYMTLPDNSLYIYTYIEYC